MFNAQDVVHMVFWPFVFLICAILLAAFVVAVIAWLREKPELDLSHYIRKPFLFDSKPEFELFKLLIDLYQDRYYVFPQVHYIHLIQPRKGIPHAEWFGLRSRIDKKSADFVLCDKERVQAQLIIELDGPMHDFPDRQKRDGFINDLMKMTDMKILHLKTTNYSRDFVQSEVDRTLNPEKMA